MSNTNELTDIDEALRLMRRQPQETP